MVRGATKDEVEKDIFQVHEHMENIRNNKDMKQVKSQEKCDGRKLYKYVMKLNVKD